jgi:tetratricopeptide (TPR) repeat protein
LSADGQTCLRAAAVLGEQFDVGVLTRILDGSGDSLRVIELLDEAEAAGLVMRGTENPGAFRFTDAAARAAVYGKLTNADRVRLHGSAARAIEALHAGDLESHCSQLAYHFSQTGADDDGTQAVAYALKAAARFSALHRHDDAVSAYELARTALLRSAPDPAQHCELLLGLATAQQRAGHKLEARPTFEEAAELARRLGTPELLAQAALGYGDARSWGETGVVNHTLVSLLEDALRSLPASQRGLRARVQARLAEEMYDRPPDERRAPLRAAVAAARRSRDPAVLAQVLLSRRFALWVPENVEQRRDGASEAVALARKARDLEVEAQGVGWLIGDLLELGLVREADLQIQAFAKLAEQLNQPVLRRHELGLRSMRAAMLGRFDDAERLATEGLQIGAALQDADAPLLFGAQLFALRRLQGRLEEVEPTARAFSDSLQNVWMWRVALATISAELGRATDARHELDFLARNDFADLFRDAHWLTAIAMLAEVCTFLRDFARASILYELLVPFAARHIIAVPGIASAGAASYYLGLLASTMGQWPVAIRHFEAALKMNKAMQAVPHVAQTEHAFAAALLGRNQGTDAKQAAKFLASAIATYERLGMHAHLARARALANSKPSPPAALPEGESLVFFFDSEEWSVTWRRKALKLKDVRGLSVIAHLVRHPRRRYHVTELAPVADGVTHVAESTSVRSLSAQQCKSLRWHSYWRELHRLEWETGNAERRGDRSALRAFRRKTALMRKQLEREKVTEVEQVRKRIGRNLATAFKAIGKQSEDLRRHLVLTIDPRSKEISYDPEARETAHVDR